MEVNDRLRELVEPVLAANNVKLYEMKWLGNERTLQIAVMREDGTMDLDTCAEVSDALSKELDQYEALSTAYTLEVCSPGAEREIRDLSELKSMDHPYVFVRLKHPIGKIKELTGEIQSYENGEITISYRDKAAQRTAVFAADEVEFIRLAVRI